MQGSLNLDSCPLRYFHFIGRVLTAAPCEPNPVLGAGGPKVNATQNLLARSLPSLAEGADGDVLAC